MPKPRPSPSPRPAREVPEAARRLSDLKPLRYTSGGAAARARAAVDLPEHVRAASGLRWLGERLVLIQDDVNAFGLLSRDGQIEPLLLPAGAGGLRRFEDARGNKQQKLDLEAALVLPDGRLLAFGSGSLPNRERLALWQPGQPPRLIDGAALYSQLHQQPSFSGSELNLEGAVLVDGRVRLFQRGNGAPRGALLPLNATIDLDLAEFLTWLDRQGPAPRLFDTRQWDLGQIQGVPRCFTDAALDPSGRICFLAVAEHSANAIDDGPCLGSWFGWFEGPEAYLAPILEPDQTPTHQKLEGLEFEPHSPSPWVVADADNPNQPSLLGRLS